MKWLFKPKQPKQHWTIILHCSRRCWWAYFQELGIHLPLEFKPETYFDLVFESMKLKYPEATIILDRVEIKEGEARCVLRH
jgi:hypothetical protein